MVYKSIYGVSYIYLVVRTLACLWMKDSQMVKKKAKIPRVIDEGWNLQKQLSGPVEREIEGENPCILIQSSH